MQDTTRKLLSAVALTDGLELLIFGAQYYAGTRFSVADILGLGADAQLLGLRVSAIMFFGGGSRWVRRSKTNCPIQQNR